MLRRLFILLVLTPLLCSAQSVPAYKTVSLDRVFGEWDEITKTYNPGMSVMQPQKLQFGAKYVAAPHPCSNRALEMIFNALGKPGVLNQVAVTHCIRFVSESGRSVNAWIQDSLIPGFNADAKVDAQIEIWADFLAYAVGSDRSRNMPVMLVNRFQTK